MGSGRIKYTLQYFKEVVWTGLNQRTVNGGSPRWHKKSDKKYLDKGVELNMTRIQFYSWCDDHSEEILSFYKLGKTPSIDRKQGYLHYDLSSIRILDLKENNRGGGFNCKYINSRPIIGHQVDTGDIIKFDQIVDVKKSGFNAICVWRVLNGLRKSYKRYVWIYQDDTKRVFNKKHIESRKDDLDGLIKFVKARKEYRRSL